MTARETRPGIFRRRIRIHAEPGRVRADIEDDIHRYGTEIRHDGTKVTAVEGIALRTPWTLCGLATRQLERLVGMALSGDPQEVYRHTDGRDQCTHLFDMAGLAVAHAGRGAGGCVYDIEVHVAAREGPRRGLIRRDGTFLFEMTVDADRVLAPAPFAGQSLSGLMKGVKAEYPDPDDREALFLLRRAFHIAGARDLDLDRLNRADETGGGGANRCFVYHPERAHRAFRVKGQMRDFTDAPERLLADLAEERGIDGSGAKV